MKELKSIETKHILHKKYLIVAHSQTLELFGFASNDHEDRSINIILIIVLIVVVFSYYTMLSNRYFSQKEKTNAEKYC